jgi:hypothetical protein
MKFDVMDGVIRLAAGSQQGIIAGASALFLLGAWSGAQAAPKARTVEPVAVPQGPLLVVVSLASQRLAVYDKNGRILESPVSSGQPGHETPQGVFAVIERNREHFSNLYNDAPMPNMQRITWSGVAMHAGNLPGYAASHGCIRLPYGASERMFGLTRLGTRVVVAAHDVAPIAFEHPRLFTVRSDEATHRVAEAATLASPRSGMGLSSVPMMLSAAVIGPAQASSRLPPLSDPFAGRPAEVPRATWASELQSRAQQADAKAKAARIKATLAEKQVSRQASQTLAAERIRSALAAKLDAIEARLATALKPAAAVRAEQDKAAIIARLATVMTQIDQLRTAEEEARGVHAALAAEANATEEARAAAGSIARDANRSLKPVSVFVSRKAGRLYVRQGFQPLFDVPVDIADASMPIGTHIFTALDVEPGSAAVQWSAVTSVGGAPGDDEPVIKRSRRGKQPTVADVDPRPRLTAAAALDRIDIPDDVRARIGQMLMPGSSLIVSDEGVSSETGKGTDFVVLTR